jgi:hypothetical protein
MLILRRKEGQWVEVTHRSGETIRIRVCNIRSRYPGQLDLAFDDPDRNFVIQRPERAAKLAPTAPAPQSAPVVPAAVPDSITIDPGPITAAAAPTT